VGIRPQDATARSSGQRSPRNDGLRFMGGRDPHRISRIMAAVRSNQTRPERLLRRGVQNLGRTYRLWDKNLPGCPDLVFPEDRLAVFVDGDFWHGRQWRLRGHRSLASQFASAPNRKYWIEKITRNIARDRRASRRLRRLGWRVLRIWESDLLSDRERCLKRVGRALGKI
jgi:DNA mismatch endonuclease (patch repair protein)